MGAVLGQATENRWGEVPYSCVLHEKNLKGCKTRYKVTVLKALAVFISNEILKALSDGNTIKGCHRSQND